MNRDILRLAVPNILSNISVPLLGAVDTALVGHLDGLEYIGAVAIGSMIFSFIYWGFGFLRMGTTGLTAQAYGQENNTASLEILGRASVVSIALAALLLACQWPIAELSFFLIEGSPDVEFFANEYFRIRLLAAPATLLLFAMHGWFLGMQNARYPLYLSLFVNIVNIALSYFFVRVMDLNSAGVAWGSVAAQYAGLTLAVVLFFTRYKAMFRQFMWRSILERDGLKRFLNVNTDIFVRTICLVAAFTFFTAKSAELGDDILAVNSILLQLWNIMAYGVDGFAFAAESLVGRFIGERDSRKLRRVIKRSLVWGGLLGVIFAALYYFLDAELLGLFTNKPEIILFALSFMPWTILAPLINTYAFIWDGVFIGATDGRALRNSMLFCTTIIFLPTYYFCEPILGNHALWLAMTSFMLFRGVSLSVLARTRINQWI